MKRRRAGSPRRGERASFSQVGIAWYRPEQWDRLLEISKGRDDLEMTGEEWQRQVDKGMLGLIKRGVIPERVDVDVEELLAWCMAQNQPVR